MATLSGRCFLRQGLPAPGAGLRVELWRLGELRGNALALTKAEFFGAAGPGTERAVLVACCGADGVDDLSFRFAMVEPGCYALVGIDAAAVQLDSSAPHGRRISFGSPALLGWFVGKPYCGWGGSETVVRVVNGATLSGLDITLWAPTPVGTPPRFHASAPASLSGNLRVQRGCSVLELWGGPRERGYAHGWLLAQQIVDFLEAYILEDNVQSVQYYENTLIPTLEGDRVYLLQPEFLLEAEAMAEAIHAAGAISGLLSRPLHAYDIVAISTYGHPTDACTQFAFWGAATEGSDVAGGTVVGRNMDGECDVRKVTVSHLIVFARHAPAEARTGVGRRMVSVMWPGWIGTNSGMNEDGLYQSKLRRTRMSLLCRLFSSTSL